MAAIIKCLKMINDYSVPLIGERLFVGGENVKRNLKEIVCTSFERVNLVVMGESGAMPRVCLVAR